MKAIYKILTCVSIVLVCLLVSIKVLAAPQPQSINVVMDNNYPPYVFQGGDGKLQGILIDQWKIWGQKTGIKAVIHAMDWGEALRRMKAGEFDVIDTIFKTEERSRWLDFTKPYATLEVPVFFDKEISGISDAASLKGFVVAVKEGDAAVELLKQNGVETLLLFKSYEEIISAAREHKITVFVVDNPPAHYFLHKFGIHDQFKKSPPLNTGEFHRAVKKGDNVLLNIVNDGFGRIPEAELERINDRWLGSSLTDGRFLRYFLVVSAALGLLVLLLLIWNLFLKRGIESRTAELRRSEEKYRQITENIKDVIWQITTDWRFSYISPAVKALIGYSPEEMIGRRIFEFFTPESQAAVMKKAEERQRTAGQGVMLDSAYYEIEHVCKDGTTIWADVVSTPVYDQNGKVTGFQGLTRDISERRKAEKSLRESEERFKEVFSSANDGILIADIETRHFIMGNRMICRMLNYTEEEISGLGVADIHPEKDLPYVIEQFEKQMRREKFLVKDIPVKRKDGSVFYADVNSSSITLGGKICLMGIFRDMTEQRTLEEQLRHYQKMESIGTLAGGIAHDFNNILAAIIGYGHLALMRMAKNDPIRLNIEQMLEASDRAAHLTKDLLLFSRKQASDRRLIDLNEVTTKLEKFLVRIIGEDITFRITASGDGLTILADAHQIEQVLMNLATNARDAMPMGGTFTISLSKITLDDAFAAVYRTVNPGNYAMISVSDTGKGMDKKTCERIFEPFFTTKEVGKGTGLGLSVVYGIIKQHNGVIEIFSQPEVGTTFRIYLPLVLSDAGTEIDCAADEQPAAGSETILLAEDNEAVRNMTVAVLKDFGYAVITAVDGEDAVNRYRENRDIIQLLLFDLIMPGKTGKEAYDEIRQMRPDIKILFASGYSPDVLQDKLSIENGANIVSKPISPAELLNKVRSVLDQGSTRKPL